MPDKGDSIKAFLDLVQKEVQYRQDLSGLEESVKQLSLENDLPKHDLKLCGFEKTPKKERYKPFATLNKTIEIKPDRRVFNYVEDCKIHEKPTKLIPLSESLTILKKQEERVKVI